MIQAAEIKLRSGETCRVTQDRAVEGLRRLHSYYAGQEKHWHKITYHSEETFNQGYEREWMKYREEASVLAFAIMALTGKLPADEPVNESGAEHGK